MFARALSADLDRPDATDHELLSTSTAALAPLALVSAPQATFEVTTLADVVDANDGVLSLREAIDFANARTGFANIVFARSNPAGSNVPDPRADRGAVSSIPMITDDLVIRCHPLDLGLPICPKTNEECPR